MITEDYVSFETAKLLKEKEFDEPCYTWNGVDVDKYIDEVRGREPKFNLDKLREVAVPLSDEEKEAHRKLKWIARNEYEECKRKIAKLEERYLEFKEMKI